MIGAEQRILIGKGGNMNTFYRFHLNGITYNVTGANRFEAQGNAERANGIDLTGAQYEEIYKLRTVRTGIIK
jgi:hypothetical protein